MSVINFQRLESNGEKHTIYKLKKEEVNVNRLGKI